MHLFSAYSMEKQSLQYVNSTYVVGWVGMEEKNTKGSPKAVRRLVKVLV